MKDMPASTTRKQQLDYNEWLQKGRDITAQHGNVQWAVGDWVSDGQCEFDYKELVDFDYLTLIKTIKADGSTGFKGPTVPHFWKDVAAETNMAVPTLKALSRVARAYPLEKRFKELSWTHHAEVAAYEKRLEYLQLCLDQRSCLGEWKGRPRTVAWLIAYVQNLEGKSKEIEAGDKIVRFYVSPETFKKLHEVGRYYHTKIPVLIGKPCEAVVETFLEQMAEKISLARDGIYEGKWPFSKILEDRRKKLKHKPRTQNAINASKNTGPRRVPRGNAVARAHGKKMTAGLVSIRKIRRAELVA